MLSGVNVMYPRVYQELLLISYDERKEGKICGEGRVKNFQVKEQFST
jgi:hypothetical protein